MARDDLFVSVNPASPSGPKRVASNDAQPFFLVNVSSPKAVSQKIEMHSPTRKAGLKERSKSLRSMIKLPQMKEQRLPFKHNTEIGFLETFKMVVMCVLLIPLIKFILIIVGYLWMYVLAKFVHWTNDDVSQPLNKFGDICRRLLCFQLRVQMAILGFYWVPSNFP